MNCLSTTGYLSVINGCLFHGIACPMDPSGLGAPTNHRTNSTSDASGDLCQPSPHPWKSMDIYRSYEIAEYLWISWVSMDRRLGGDSNQEIVSCRAMRACVRARGLVAQWNSIPKEVAPISPFPFMGRRFSFFPFGSPNFSFSLV